MGTASPPTLKPLPPVAGWGPPGAMAAEVRRRKGRDRSM